jgi:hypothetical protein
VEAGDGQHNELCVLPSGPPEKACESLCCTSDMSCATRAATHPALIQGLKRHEDLKKQHIAQAERVRQLQTANINNMFECEKQQAENESAVHLATLSHPETPTALLPPTIMRYLPPTGPMHTLHPRLAVLFV